MSKLEVDDKVDAPKLLVSSNGKIRLKLSRNGGVFFYQKVNKNFTFNFWILSYKDILNIRN